MPWWNCLQMAMMSNRCWSGTSISFRNFLATASRASFGHSWNQSMVQQFTREGNCRSRSRNASPIGDRHSTMCRFFFVWSMKKFHSSAGVSSFMPIFLEVTRHISSTAVRSSYGNIFGTSPAFSRLLMSSTKLSSLIWVSENRNTAGLHSPPAVRQNFFRSSRHSTVV